MSRIGHRRSGRTAAAIFVTILAVASISQSLHSVLGRRSSGGTTPTEPLTVAPATSQRLDASVPSAADVRFSEDAGNEPAVATF